MRTFLTGGLPRLYGLLAVVVVAACGGTPRAQTAKAEADTKVEAKTQVDAETKPEAEAKTVRAVPPSPEKVANAAKKADPLTQEELDLIAADPKTLSREDRVKRGYALRKKIMQNPDSPMARQLEEMGRRYEAGELDGQLPEHLRKNGTNMSTIPGHPDTGITFKARTIEDAKARPSEGEQTK